MGLWGHRVSEDGVGTLGQEGHWWLARAVRGCGEGRGPRSGASDCLGGDPGLVLTVQTAVSACRGLSREAAQLHGLN